MAHDTSSAPTTPDSPNNRLSPNYRDPLDEATVADILPDSLRPEPSPFDTLPPVEIPSKVEAPRKRNHRGIVIGASVLAGTLFAGVGTYFATRGDEKVTPDTSTGALPKPDQSPAVVVETPDAIQTPNTDPANIPPAVEQDPSNTEPLVIADEIPSNVVEHGMFDTLSPQEKENIKSMEAITDINVFRALPQADQIKFANFIVENNKGNLVRRMEYKKEDAIAAAKAANEDADTSAIDFSYVYDYERYSPDTPDYCAAYTQYIRSIMTSLKTLNDGGINLDTLTAKKVASLLGATNETMYGAQIAVDIDTEIDSWNSGVTVFTEKPQVVAALVTPDLINAEIDNMYPESVQIKYRQEPFTDTAGVERTVWVPKEVVRQGNGFWSDLPPVS